MDPLDNEISFPQKPVITKKNDSVSKSISNVLLFLAISYFYFDKSIYLVVAVFIILAIHEIGHLVAMRIFNYTDLKIFFIPILGAYASGNKKEISQKQSIIIYLCGPIPGILIGIGLYYYNLNVQNNLLYTTSFIFLIINLFNLLPIKPLDGGNLLSTLLIDSNKILQKGFIVVSILLMIGLSIYLKSYILLIIPFFMIMGQLKINKIDKVKENLTQQGFDINISFDDLSDKDYWIIRTEIVNSFTIFNKVKPDVLQISEQETKIAEYVRLSIQENIVIKDLTPYFKKTILLIFLFSIVLSLHYIQALKVYNNPNKNRKLYEQLSNDEVEVMKKKCIDRFNANLKNNNYEAFCDCYIDKIIQKYTVADFDRILKLDKQSQNDAFSQMILECAKINNDTTIYKGLLLKK